MEHSPSDETNNETVKSKVTHDPGWNDPPIFSYGDINATALTKTPKKTLLNKRVAFPMNLQSSSSSPVTSSSDVLPSVPPSNMIPPASMPNVAATGSASDTATNIVEHSGQNLLKEGALQKVLKDFEEILTVGSDDLKRNSLEIRRRLDIMKKMWEEDKLTPEIHTKMVQLSEALSSGNPDLADNIHMGLMVDHISVCSPWMVGVRQLIHYIKTQAAKAEIKENTLEAIPNSGNWLIFNT